MTAVQILFLASPVICIAIITAEWFQFRRSGRRFPIGLKPLGGVALALAVIWVAIALLSLVDFESNHRLFMSLTFYDHSTRVNWIESVIRTGIPPDNSLYSYKHPAPMRNYYFWYVVCAVVSRASHLPVRTVLFASCVWAGFALAALAGLYFKHFLKVGDRLRSQVLISILLLSVGGFDFCIYLYRLVFLLIPPGPPLLWEAGQINCWFFSLLFVPHHVCSMVCCMFAFLLIWISREQGWRGRTLSVSLAAAALASAFGLSIYVSFAFSLLMLAWGLWQIVIERKSSPTLLLAAAAAGAMALVLPFLRQLAGGSSGMSGGSAFGIAVRQTILPDGLMSTRLFRYISEAHQLAALNLVKSILLVPGIVCELGFFAIVLVVSFVPKWRNRKPLGCERRSLLFIAVSTIVLTSFVRSWVLSYNDFGVRAALFLQFPLLLLGSELLTKWFVPKHPDSSKSTTFVLTFRNGVLLRRCAAVAICLGAVTTGYIMLSLRIFLPWRERGTDLVAHNLSRKAYFSLIGYSKMNASIPLDAVVQFNPAIADNFWRNVDLNDVNRQIGIVSDQLWCGSELGGDPTGCPAMAADIDALYKGSTPQQARAVCRQYSIQYLVANIYDPAWQDRQSWVWTLHPVVADPEFRALDCEDTP